MKLDKIKLIPRSRMTPDGTNGFTLDKAYTPIRVEGNVFIVLNDNGHERAIVTDESPCAHITRLVTRGYFKDHYPCGFFEVQGLECSHCGGPADAKTASIELSLRMYPVLCAECGK